MAIWLGPLVMSLSASHKTPAEAALVPPTYLPHSFSLDDYRDYIDCQAGLLRSVRNSASVAGLSCLIRVVPAGCAVARFPSRSKRGYVFFPRIDDAAVPDTSDPALPAFERPRPDGHQGQTLQFHTASSHCRPRAT